MAAEVRVPVAGEQTDVHHAVGSDPIQSHQRHAALLRPGGDWRDGLGHS